MPVNGSVLSLMAMCPAPSMVYVMTGEHSVREVYPGWAEWDPNIYRPVWYHEARASLRLEAGPV